MAANCSEFIFWNVNENLRFVLNKRTCSEKQVLFFVRSHCVKSVLIGVFSGPYFPAFGLNTGKSPYSVQIWENTDQKRLPIWTFFAQCLHIVDIGWYVLDEKIVFIGDSLFSHVILPETVTGLLFQEFRYFSTRTKFRAGWPPWIFNYWTDHFDLPGYCKPNFMFVKDKKSAVIFRGSRQIPQRNSSVSQENR